MSKKTVSNIILTLLLMGTLAFSVQRVEAESTTIIIPDDYPTIQEAIDAASSGDTILVHEGMYADGEIIVNKPLTLAAKGQVIVDGLHTATDVFCITSNSVVIEGFIVKNAQYAGILLFHVDNCRIEGNTVANNYIGIEIGYGGYNNVVKGNKISNNYFGVYLCGMFRPTDCNVVEENVAENNSYAIDIIYSHRNVIRHNTLNNNNNASIILSFSDYNTINENKITNTNQIGIALLVSDHNIVEKNIVADNGLGIGLGGSYYNVVKENRVERSKPFYGIALYWSGRNTVKENRAFQNEEFDLYWDGIGYNTWAENKYKIKTDNIIQEED